MQPVSASWCSGPCGQALSGTPGPGGLEGGTRIRAQGSRGAGGAGDGGGVWDPWPGCWGETLTGAIVPWP